MNIFLLLEQGWGGSKVIILKSRGEHGTEVEIWTGFGPVGNTEKKLGRLRATFEGVFFSCFHGQKKFNL